MNSRFSLSTRVTRLLAMALLAGAMVPSLAAQESLPNHLSKRVVGDYGFWSKSQTPAYGAAQIPYHKLTHINHAGVSFDASGTLSVPDGFIEPALNRRAHAAGVKVLLLLGGDFPGLEASGDVQTLVDNIAAFEKQHEYDGVDMDWEFPDPQKPADRKFLVTLMEELRKSNPKSVLSIDAPPWGGAGYDLKHLKVSLDYINIMMYDCAGPWTAYGQLNSPIFWDSKDPAPWECQPGGSVHDAANIFLRQVPAKKLNMGTPFYGYHYANINEEFGLCPNAGASGDCGGTVQSKNYGTDLKPLINQRGWQTFYDPVAMVPYMLRGNGGDGYITYDDAFSTYFRVFYADWQRGLGGTFMWSLDADYDGHSQDLMDAMYNASLGGR